MATYFIGPEQPFLYNAAGSGVGAFSTGGLCYGGRAISENVGNEVRAAGNYRPIFLRDGMHRGYGSMDFYVQGYSGILAKIVRVSTKLTDFSLRVGNTEEYETHKYCKVDTARIEAVAGGDLRCSLDWKATEVAVATGDIYTAHPAPSGNKNQIWCNAAIAGFGNYRAAAPAALEIIAFSLSISNNVDWLPVLDTAVAPERKAKYLREGGQVVAVNIRALAMPNVDLSANAISQLGTVTFTFDNGDTTILMTLSDLLMVQQERPINPDTLIEHGVNYMVRAVAIAAS